MTRRTRSLAPVPTVISFIDCINRGDLDGLGRLMAQDHRLNVLDERPLVGRSPNIEAKMLVIWAAIVVGGFLRSWAVIEDTPEARAQHGLPPG